MDPSMFCEKNKNAVQSIVRDIPDSEDSELEEEHNDEEEIIKILYTILIFK